ncbi:MAG: ATP-binding protein [Monoglobaceae bacterium]
MSEVWYRVKNIPDLTLNKYASLEDTGVEGVLRKHIAFLRQLNRKGIISDLSVHLFYLYISSKDAKHDLPGKRLQLFFMIKCGDDTGTNIHALIDASPLSDFFEFSPTLTEQEDGRKPIADINNYMKSIGLNAPNFKSCSFLSKTETLLPSVSSDCEDYYILREWDTNNSGRLYNMFMMMEALDTTALYRVDLYPVEKSDSLRSSLREPIRRLRQKQDDRLMSGRRDYDGKDALDNYVTLLEKFESSPHFIANIMTFGINSEDSTSILDAAGAESLLKGKYSVSTFEGDFNPLSFLCGDAVRLKNSRENMIVKPSDKGLIVCREDKADLNLNYLPSLFTLEEIAPFFRFPALYDGENIQIPKETAPEAVDSDEALYLGKDEHKYDVNFPLELFSKHAFISGVPGSGKTNTMHHITSTLWKKHNVPFLVFEPAKREYRALANDPEMKDMYLFSPNADMDFPLHINPFEMPKGVMVSNHIDMLFSVFAGTFPLIPPLPYLLDNAIEEVYRQTGWIPEDVYTGNETDHDGEKRKFPTMSMLYSQLEKELEKRSYSEDTSGDIKSALQVRIGSLLKRAMGDIFDVQQSTLEPEKWLEVPAVIELESMGTDPANFLTLMLCSLIRETLSVNSHCDRELRHVIFIEEAHNLIGPDSNEQQVDQADPKSAATAFIVKMLAEVRALKEGIVIADQLPTKMAQEVLKNTGLKIALRITAEDDRSLLGGTMAASPLQLERVATYDIGEALIFYEKLKKPFYIKINKWRNELEDEDEWKANVTPKSDAELRECIKDYPTYREQSEKSARIICQKYYNKFKSIEGRIEGSANWYYSVMNVITGIKQCEEQVRAANINDNESYDKQQKLLDILSRALSKKQGVGYVELFDEIEMLSRWIFSFERLKDGRWKRCNLSEASIVRASFVEQQFISTCLKIYQRVTNLYNKISNIVELQKTANALKTEIVRINSDICKIKHIKTAVDKMCEDYRTKHGVESLYVQ